MSKSTNQTTNEIVCHNDEQTYDEHNDEQTYERPITTNNQLVDIINWLKLGDIVVIYNAYGSWRVFHNQCEKQCLVSTSDPKPKITCRISTIYCKTIPGLLDEGEWEYYIKQEGNSECECLDIVNRINKMMAEKEPNVFNFVI